MADKPAQVRFYVDADLLGLAKVLVQMRADVTFPSDPGGTLRRRIRPPCAIERVSTPDPEWIPFVASQGWLIITRDKRIQSRIAERVAVLRTGARMVNLAGPDAGDTWRQLEIVMINWRRIEQLLDAPGPFIYSASRTTLRPIEL